MYLGRFYLCLIYFIILGEAEWIRKFIKQGYTTRIQLINILSSFYKFQIMESGAR